MTDNAACPAPWQESWTADSAIALCLPAGFTARGPHGFARARGDILPEHWIAIRAACGSEEWSTSDPWPLRLASRSDCIADCSTVEELQIHTDIIGSVPAYVELGLVSGGFSGAVREPAMIVSAEVRPGVRLIVNARTPHTLLLDSLRMAMQSIRVGRPDQPPRAGHLTRR